jgi:hypothetical protein
MSTDHVAHVRKRKSILKSSVSSELANAYDYCMVFKLVEGKQTDYAKYIVNKMKEAKLEVFSFLSVQRDELLVLIRAPVNLFLLLIFIIHVTIYFLYSLE